jgi:N-acetylneuraminic acid mutarotase
VAAILAAVSATAAASTASTVPGTWRKLAPEPFTFVQGPTSVWTGRQLILFGRTSVASGLADAAEAYDPATDTWTKLSPPAGPGYVPGYRAVWTGREMLAFGAFHSVAYDPAASSWRELRKPVPGGAVVWTGREAIGWGGGCCGDASSSGVAYDPRTDTYRNLPRSPLAPEQQPIASWTGRELVLFVSGINPVDGKPYPARLARAAAYDPQANTWRRIAPLPTAGVRFMGTAAWDGREVLVTATGAHARSTYAYNPRTNRWRRLEPLPAPRLGATAIWTGKRLLVWGGQNLAASLPGGRRDGLVYEPLTNRWSAISKAPLRSSGSTVAWTGRSLLVFGGMIGASRATHNEVVYLRVGAAFTPAS